jgi:mannose-6-phosphate isomerase class I
MFDKTPINPVRHFRSKTISSGYDQLLTLIERHIARDQCEVNYIALDGTNGVPFRSLIDKIKTFFEKREYGVDVIYVQDFMKNGDVLRSHFENNITDNRAFGYKTNRTISDYFKEDAKEAFKKLLYGISKNKHSQKKIILTAGPGAYWISQSSFNLNLFFDISREMQQLMYKKGLLNFGMPRNIDQVEKYKIAYFVEWPILENYRKKYLREMDFYIDINNEERPNFLSTFDLKNVIQDISRSPLRVKPFFAPGVWGGQYLKKLANLPGDWVNCAWSFEPIAPENSILIGIQDYVLEVPFLIVMAQSYEDILGKRVADLFGDYFPIRFDFLDTMDGQNLSCQVHPNEEFMRKQFNEVLEQQESYYIMENSSDSKVYLGLTEECDGEEFIKAVKSSQETADPIEFTNYVQEWESKKGDLFLIPTSTVHCSGKNNLVLEISATTWWFTLKIYDYVRKDLDGKPRPINIEFAEENIDFSRKKTWVKENLIQQPKLILTQGKNEEYLLGQRNDLLFYVNRIHLKNEFIDDTKGEFLLFNLVEGERVRLVSTEDESHSVELSYAESYIVPSIFGKFKIINLGSIPCKLIKAGVSKDWNRKLRD